MFNRRKILKIINPVCNRITYPIPIGWLFEMKLKKSGLFRKKNDIEAIVLGSSHGDYGFNPIHYNSKISYNLCTASQDLYYSSNLLKITLEKLPKCREIILFYSVFSAGFDLIKTSEKLRSAVYAFYWGIPSQVDDQLFQKAYKKIKLMHKIVCVKPGCEYFGYNNQKPCFTGYSVGDRVLNHIKHNNRGNEQIKYLYSMFELLQKCNAKFIIVIPPARADYRKSCLKYYMDSGQLIFKQLYECVDRLPGVNIMNFFEDNEFSNTYFGDYDHLNDKGAELLTQKICAKSQYLNNMISSSL